MVVVVLDKTLESCCQPEVTSLMDLHGKVLEWKVM